MKSVFVTLVFLLLLGLIVGNTSCSNKDTTPPTAPANLSYELINNNSDIVFKWDASTDKDSGISGYLVETSWQGDMSENWVYVTSESFDTFIPITLASGLYTFQVKALDKAHNESDITSIEFQWEA